MMELQCAFCFYGPADKVTIALYVIDGQAVCQEHVNDADGPFGPALRQLYRDRDKPK